MRILSILALTAWTGVKSSADEIQSSEANVTPLSNHFDSGLLETTERLTAHSSQTRIWNYHFDVGSVIPDAEPSGRVDHRQISDDGVIVKVELTLAISGGANGDYYVYLEHEGQIVILMNRVGKSAELPNGYNEPGFTGTFRDDGAMGDIHIYRTTLTGNETTPLNGPLTPNIANGWMPDGRNISPFNVTTDTPRTSTLDTFRAHQLAGGWTLFASDLSTGQEGVLMAWDLQVTTIPEPGTITLMVAGGIFFLAKVCRRKRRSPC